MRPVTTAGSRPRSLDSHGKPSSVSLRSWRSSCSRHGSDWAERRPCASSVDLFILLALAQMWNLLAGFAGVVSVGQQAFVGLGAYGMIVFANNHDSTCTWSILLARPRGGDLSDPDGARGVPAARLATSPSAPGCWQKSLGL